MFYLDVYISLFVFSFQLVRLIYLDCQENLLVQMLLKPLSPFFRISFNWPSIDDIQNRSETSNLKEEIVWPCPSLLVWLLSSSSSKELG